MLKAESSSGAAPSFKKHVIFKQSSRERERSVSEGFNQRPSVQPPDASTIRLSL